jgi:hypothetical protein
MSRTEGEMATYGLIPDMRAEVDIPRDGILSRTVYIEGTLSLTLFGFNAGRR